MQNRVKSDNDSGTGTSEGMANGNSSSVHVDLGGVQIQQLGVGQTNHREGLVELVKVNVLGLEASSLQSHGDSQSGGSGELDGFIGSLAPRHNLEQGLETELLDLGGRSKDDSGTSVVDGGGVGGGHATVLLEDGSGGLELVLVQVLVLLVLGDNNTGLASETGQLNGGNLVLELAGGVSSLGLLVRANGKLVLLLSRDGVGLSTDLGGNTHGLAIVGVKQTVSLDTVNERTVAVLVGDTGLHVVGHVGHGLGTAGNNNVGRAGHDGLGTLDDGLHAGGAYLVDGGGDNGVGQTGLESDLSSGGLANAGREHVTEDDLVNLLGLEVGLGESGWVSMRLVER